MAAGRCNAHIGLVGSEPERVLSNLRAGTADSTSINEIYLIDHSARARGVHYLLTDDLDVLSELSVNRHVED